MTDDDILDVINETWGIWADSGVSPGLVILAALRDAEAIPKDDVEIVPVDIARLGRAVQSVRWDCPNCEWHRGIYEQAGVERQ